MKRNLLKLLYLCLGSNLAYMIYKIIQMKRDNTSFAGLWRDVGGARMVHSKLQHNSECTILNNFNSIHLYRADSQQMLSQVPLQERSC